MFRWIFRIFLLAALLLVGLVLARNRIATRLLVSRLEHVTHLPCSVGSVEIHLASPVVEACAVSIHNPPYGSRVPMALGIRSITARYDPWSLLRGRVVFATLDMDIAIANCVRSPDGTTNLRLLHDRLVSAGGGKATPEVGELSLRLETARYVDESRGAPRIQEVARHDKRMRRAVHGEEAVLKTLASMLAQVQAADPFEMPAVPAPKPSTPSKKTKPSKEGH